MVTEHGARSLRGLTDVQRVEALPVVSAVLAGVCFGFLPHNFNPARIFMGDTGSMLLGLLLAYGPISSAASLDYNLLVTHSQGANPVNRFPTILPLLIPIAIWLIPYTDMLLAVIRRTMKGMSPFDADRQHLHHRLQNMGHSHRQTVLLMYLWAATFHRPRGRPVGAADQPDLVRRHHARRRRGPAARDGADAPPPGAPPVPVSGSGQEEAAYVPTTRSPLPIASPAARRNRRAAAAEPPGRRRGAGPAGPPPWSRRTT